MNLILWLVAFIGHLGFWCVVFNRTHATRWKRKVRKLCEKLVILSVLMPIGWIAVRMYQQGTFSFQSIASFKFEFLYLYLAVGLGAFFIARWSRRKLQPKPTAVLSSRRSLIDVQRDLGRNLYLTPLAKTLKKIPFNQSHLIAIESIELGLPTLPAQLDGLKLCQLSDFHLTGQIDIAWFERVVAEVNQFEPDIILITGDLIDEFHCLDWIEPIFGQLKSKHGTYFVRGNHDLRIRDQELLLQRLKATGMKFVGGQRESIEIDGARLTFVGNELPWYPGAELLKPETQPADSLQILLTHTPDQIEWATPFNFDLIFAGHNHGGQIALPIVGPIVAPSKYGVLYAAGTFEVSGAVMHVSRGLSGDECIRINCPPEVGCFTLRTASTSQQNPLDEQNSKASQ